MPYSGAFWIAPKSVQGKLALVPVLAPVYKKAFAGSPWFEVSRCGCPHGFSAQTVGERCTGACGQMITQEAYPLPELISDLSGRLQSRRSFVYTEMDADGHPFMGVIAYRRHGIDIYREKYEGRENPLAETLFTRMPQEVAWLDEIFADLERRPNGNLRNFGRICTLMAEQLDCRVISFRTINERLIGKARSVFGDACTEYRIRDRGALSGVSSLLVIDLEPVTADLGREQTLAIR